LEVCLKPCKKKDNCKELVEVPRNEIDQLLAKNHNPNASPGGVVITGKFEAPGKLVDILGDKSEDPEEATMMIHRAVSLRDRIEDQYWEMGETLSVIYRKKYFITDGHGDWKSFCERILDFKTRKATYLKDIYNKFSLLNVSVEDRKGIGWGRLKELLPIVNPQNVSHWLEMARQKDLSVQALNAQVKHALGKITAEEAGKVPQVVAFSLYQEQRDGVERALDIARQMTGSESRGYQLEMVCNEFRITYENAEEEYPKVRIVQEIIARFEATFKVKVGEILDLETGEIIKS
jgi:hypothetical protein